MMHRDSVSSRTCFLSLAALFAASTALWAPGVAQAATTVLSTGVDTYVDSFEPTTYFGDPLEPGTGNPAEASGIPGGDGYYGMKWDTNIGATSSPNESLLWFDIPPALLAEFAATPGATASVSYNVFDGGSSADMHRMTFDWLTPNGNLATWSNLSCGGGVDLTGGCTNAETTSNATATGSLGINVVDVTTDVLAWATGTPNYGWGLEPNGSSRVRVETFENGVSPTLTVVIPEPEVVMHFDFNETGNAPGSTGTDARPVKMRNNAGTAVDLHSADAGGVSGSPGDRAFDNTGPSDHGDAASSGTNGFRADQSVNPAIDSLSAFTISGWFKTDDTSALTGKTPRLVNNHNGDGINLQFLSSSDGDLKLEVDTDTAEAASTGLAYSAKQTWVFFAVSYDGLSTSNNVNFYVGFRNDAEAGGGVGSANVALVNTASLNRGPLDPGTGDLHLGNRSANNRPFDGFLDEIRIENSAHTGAAGLAALEAHRQAALVAPIDVEFRHVDNSTVSASVLDEDSTPFTVHELSGVAYDADTDRFWAISDDSPSAVLIINAQFDGVGGFTSASSVSAVSLDDNMDFEGIVYTNVTRDSVFLSEEGNPDVLEYSRVDGSLLQTLSVPAVFGNRRSNRGFEALSRSADASEMLTGVEQALTVDGPNGNSSTEGSVSRWLRYSVSGNVATAAEQYAYVLEPAHDTPVSSNGSGLSDFVILPNGDLLTLERSEAASEFLIRVFLTQRTGATDVSIGALGSGLIGETYTPVTKTLLFSDDSLQKMEGLALGPVLGSGDFVLLGVEDDNGATNVVRSFVLSGDFAGAVCGDGNVDVGEDCDEGGNNGTAGQCCSATCSFEPIATECRASAGACDATDFCDGASVACTADVKLTSECRASSDVCDVAETCDGVADTCPVDGFEPITTECRSAVGVCDAADMCDGASAACPVDAKLTSECRASSDVCDVAETCDGVADTCPLDGFEPNGTACDDSDVCTSPDACLAGVCEGIPVAGPTCEDPPSVPAMSGRLRLLLIASLLALSVWTTIRRYASA